jgi:hypothetical protein
VRSGKREAWSVGKRSAKRMGLRTKRPRTEGLREGKAQSGKRRAWGWRTRDYGPLTTDHGPRDQKVRVESGKQKRGAGRAGRWARSAEGREGFSTEGNKGNKGQSRGTADHGTMDQGTKGPRFQPGGALRCFLVSDCKSGQEVTNSYYDKPSHKQRSDCCSEETARAIRLNARNDP